ncbi:hypothetical protein [Actinomadura chibensis]|uniref:Uncharacterized protein n=1 Tax=Actinomadura chibensis TaxID=392828 RepID=A0A5D0N8R3_9ACTN|nr:hypothetical protein [Actinomadura chibensis]TYB40803.1 hypothetical protein FXF69_37930 [Actinomadura chibensis]
MAEIWGEDRLVAEGFGRVLIELDWYDGLRAGLAEVDGKVHYFESRNYVDLVEEVEYRVWPASDDAVAMEREQWTIYVEWNRRYEAGDVGPGRHPGHGGVDVRYDELTSLLTPHREAPADAQQLVAEWRFGPGARYQVDGIDTWVRWKARDTSATNAPDPSQ